MNLKFLISLILSTAIVINFSCCTNTCKDNTGNNTVKPKAAKPTLSKEKIRNIKLCIQPFGNFDSELLDTIKKVIQENYKVTLTINGYYDLPSYLYYAPLNMYAAAGLLDYLDTINAKRYNKIIGLTANDIYDPKNGIKYWGILGLANMGESASIVSIYRLRRDSYQQHYFITGCLIL